MKFRMTIARHVSGMIFADQPGLNRKSRNIIPNVRSSWIRSRRIHDWGESSDGLCGWLWGSVAATKPADIAFRALGSSAWPAARSISGGTGSAGGGAGAGGAGAATPGEGGAKGRGKRRGGSVGGGGEPRAAYAAGSPNPPRAALFHGALFPGRREVLGDRDGYLPGRGPFGAALERGDEPDAAHPVEVV